MNPNKEYSQKQILRLRQKTKLRMIIAGSCVIVFSAILILYFNITQVNLMKANGNSTNAPVEKNTDMNVNQIKIDTSFVNHRGAEYKIAKPL